METVATTTPKWWTNAWKIPPRQLRTRDWAEKNIEISKGSLLGQFRISSNPMLGPILDILDMSELSEVALKKAVQAGGSLVARIFMARRAHTDPSQAMLVLPSQQSGKDQIKKYWRPLLRGKECKVLREFQRGRNRTSTKAPADDTDRSTYQNIVLTNGFDLLLGYSGSAQSLASHPCKIVVLDETDKYRDWDGEEAEPIDLARRRTTVFPDRKILALSTPTNERGQIAILFDASQIKVYPFIACPHCGKPIQLLFENVSWDLSENKSLVTPQDKSDYLRQNPENVYLVCGQCNGHIHEEKRKELLHSGWLGTLDDGWRICVDGTTKGTKPFGTRIGIHLSGLASAVNDGMVEIACRWIEADGNPRKVQDCKNNDQGQPFIQEYVKPAKGVLLSKCRDNEETGFVAPKSFIVPSWASRIVMTVDTQANKFYYTIRAWGSRMRSRLLVHGEAFSFQQLEQLIYHTAFKNENPSLPDQRVWMCAIDSGGGIDREGANATRTEQVYRWCAEDIRVRIAIKGSSKALENLTRLRPHDYQSPRGDTIKIGLLFVDPLGSGDVLAHFQQSKLEKVDYATGEVILGEYVDQWELNRDVTSDYLRHLQVMERKAIKKAGKKQDRWIPEADGARHDYFDCYSMDTDVLTYDGWKRFSDVTMEDKFATVNLTSDLIEYQNPSDIIAKQYSGKMIQIGGNRNSRIDMLVTPNHRMVVFPSNRNNNPSIRLAKDLKPTNRIKATASWHGDDVKKIVIPARHGSPERIVSAEDLADLVGWYVAEGYCSIRPGHHSMVSSVMIYQNPGKKRDEIIEAANRLPWGFNVTKRGVVFSSRQLVEFLEDCGKNVYSKRIPQWIKNASTNVIERFMRSYISGDGWRSKTGEHCATVSERLADDIQELWIKLGYATSRVLRPAKPYNIRGRSGTNTKPQHTVSRKTTKGAWLCDGNGKPNYEEVDYNGMVYCATVPNGTLIVRRNGKTTVCGNCERYQIALAHDPLLGCQGLPSETTIVRLHTPTGVPATTAQRVSGGVNLRIPRR